MDEARFERSAYTKAQLENYPRYKRLQKQWLRWNGLEALLWIADTICVLIGCFNMNNGAIIFPVGIAVEISSIMLFYCNKKEDKIEQQIRELKQKARN